MAPPTSAPSSSRHRRRLALLTIGGGLVVVLTAAITLAASTTAISFTSGVLAATESAPTIDDGVVDAALPLSVDEDEHPAMVRLDDGLREALRAAQVAALDDGVTFDITSGWRSADYQRWLLADAIATSGSEETARELVATPERSSHVTGRAVDIGSLDAQLWLIEHGRAWGLCQTYANERWHFERATRDGEDCPEPRIDARG